MSKNAHHYWTPEETILLKELYPKMLVRELATFFPYRNKATIVAKARALNLASAKLWQKAENTILRKRFATGSKEEFLKLLPSRTWSATLAQGERLGLARKRNRPRIKVNEEYFQTWSANMAYLVGYILSDGCIVRGTYKGYSDSLHFGVQKGDINIIEKVRRELKSEHAISSGKNAAHLTITSQKIVDDLKALGITYRKSLRERIPQIPERFIKHFIRGIVDGDGTVALGKDGYPRLGVYGGKRTMRFIRDHFFFNLGVYAKIGGNRKPGGRTVYRIAYRTSSAKIIIAFLYKNAPLFLERKREQAYKCMGVKIKYRPNYPKNVEI